MKNKDNATHNNDNNRIFQVNNLDFSGIPLPTWCKIHSTILRSEVDYLEFKVASNIFMQEMKNMEIVPSKEPNVSYSKIYMPLHKHKHTMHRSY